MAQDTYDDDMMPRGSSQERDVTPRLVHLADMSDLQVADGDPDIRGWHVRTADGEKIGSVKDLLVDTGLMKVRYFEAVIDKAVLNSGDDRHVLIPIGSARLDDDADDVYLSAALVDPRMLPVYDRSTLAREYADRRPNDDVEQNERYDDERFFGARRRGREGVNYIGPVDQDSRRRNEGL